ncbi:related to MUTS protein homolog 1 [Cephalotrichum gorgonifer]|uniref:Related to MUTS protein homolog 1 n=1 Tax=Cephalotrichum gorgonifer TaxID=2041049 RepID=A0AAE8MP33_9PEZI|nr:related to MUTS protein homolog 1 [Cephalotrichum gorgonifer]
MVLWPYHHRTAATSLYRGTSSLIISPPRRIGLATWEHRVWLHVPPGSRHHGPLPSGSARRIVRRQIPPLLVRGKKTKATLKLSDLPQGAISLPEPDAHPEEVVGPAYPTVVQQARRNMRKFDNCVLLTRVGGFYELYFEHAEEYGPLLHLKVAQKKTNAGPVSMAGFPFFQLDRFLKILVQDLSRYVAIAEEFPNTAPDKIKSGGLLHDRRVARIITPGTLIDENFMDPYANNYVMALHVDYPEHQPGQQRDIQENGALQDPSSPVQPRLDACNAAPPPPSDASPSLGLAWLDLSTGHFFTQSTNLLSLSSVLSRVSPREVILEDKDNLQSHQHRLLLATLSEDRYLVSYASQVDRRLELEDWTPMLESEIPPDARQAFTEVEVTAGSLLLGYVKDRLQSENMKLQPPLRRENMHIMSIDKNTLRALEIKQTIRDGYFRGSLLHAIRRTVTKSGARLLNEWLSSPSTSLEVINGRQELVARFIEDDTLRESITLLLRRSHDSQRLVQKFALGRGDADDLIALANTIRTTEDIVRLLWDAAKAVEGDDAASATDCLATMARRILLEDGPLKLARRIKDAIDEEGIVHRNEIEDSEAGEMMALAQEVVTSEGSTEDAASLPKGKKKRATSIREYYGEDNEPWVMKPTASPALKKLHGQLRKLLGEKAALGEALREKLGAQSLTLRWTPGLGHICHVKGKDSRALTEVRALSSSRTTRSFHDAEWTHLGQRLDQTRLHVRNEEQRVFHDLRSHVVLNLVKLRRNAAVLDELDVTTSFALLAQEQDLVRPEVNTSTAHTIIGGRHPTVESGLTAQGRTFMRNDCLVGTPSHGRLWLVTGPNMGGKSTFLRQNALITILAQIGSYVPASYASIGLVDAIFTRVGSADNLYSDQSTFMVEMMETANILRSATPRSFVIMDEIGRGTTPEDGSAVAYAALEYLARVSRCRGLFATHFHDVADMAKDAGLCVEEEAAKGVEDTRVKVGVEEGGGVKEEGGVVEMYCTDVQEDEDGGFVYAHELKKGVNRRSHALKVARLAGLPEAAIRTASRILRKYGRTD